MQPNEYLPLYISISTYLSATGIGAGLGRETCLLMMLDYARQSLSIVWRKNCDMRAEGCQHPAVQFFLAAG